MASFGKDSAYRQIEAGSHRMLRADMEMRDRAYQAAVYRASRQDLLEMIPPEFMVNIDPGINWPRAPTPVPRKRLPKPGPTATAIAADLAEYADLAAELGYAPAELGAYRLRRFTAGARMPLYDETEVAAYLHSISPPGKVWVWKALAKSTDLKKEGGYLTDGDLVNGPYTKTIPVHILRRAKQIKDFDPTAQFFVSEVADPDPFIMAMTDQGRVIFGVWDEPGFGDLKTEV